jgi:hypothetical protein
MRIVKAERYRWFCRIWIGRRDRGSSLTRKHTRYGFYLVPSILCPDGGLAQIDRATGFEAEDNHH